MLERLYIKNFALIKELTFVPDRGLNIITGETGSGKSLIIAALSLLAGKRNEHRFFRIDTKKIVVEADFSFSKELKYFLEEQNILENIDQNEPLTIRREIAISGRNRIFIQDSLINIETLQKIAPFVLDIHSQHEHQSLFNHRNHLLFLDKFAQIKIDDYQKNYQKYKSLLKLKAEYEANKSKLSDKIDLIKYHLEEIEKVNPKLDEDIQIEKELNQLEKIEDIKKSASKITYLVSEADNSILGGLKSLIEEGNFLSEINPELSKFSEDLESAYLGIEEFLNSVDYYSNSLEFDEESYNYFSKRLNELMALKKKFAKSIAEILSYQEELEEELNSLDIDNSQGEKLTREINSLRAILFKEAQRITEIRKKSAPNFCKQLEKELTDLDFKNVKLKIEIKDLEQFTDLGLNKAEITICANQEKAYYPLNKIASGGELSRIMLAISGILKTNDQKCYIYDEIDSGISGIAAEKVGEKLKSLSKNIQILTITHLPIVAGKGDSHFEVCKLNQAEELLVQINKLSPEEQIREIAKMISGSKESKEAILNAKKLINSD